MSRFPIRARVLKRADYWLLILPSGRRVVYGRWWLAMHYANEAVAKEREYERRLDPAWRAWHSDECEAWNSETGGNGGRTRHDCICGTPGTIREAFR